MSTADTLGLYLSVPFCRHKCSFCNFASGISSPQRIQQYVEDLCAEIDASTHTAAHLRADLPRRADTVYFGGGTPSLLTPSQLEQIFAALHRNFTLHPAAEITLEAAPGQIADAILATAQQLGVNRISLGVQSFIDRESAAVGRTHTAASCLEEIARLRAAGFPEVAIDLIAGLPYQTPETWQHSLQSAVSSGATHLSVYMLEVDEDSRLGLEILNNGPRLHAPRTPSADQSAAFYEHACQFLHAHGFPQYEISNFAAPQHHSRHNRKYWHRSPYLGFGLDAHSMLPTATGAVRFANPDDLASYTFTPEREVTRIDTQAAFEESIFLGLRLSEGISLHDLASTFGSNRIANLRSLAADLLREGLLTETSGRLQLTARGRMISNDIFGRLLETEPALA